ncbi:hypothetical protein ABIB94_007064 [Bradyrhizobium sp. JR7.2]
MPGNARSLFHVKDALGRDLLPLGHGLGGDFAIQGPRQASIAPDGPFCLIEGGGFHIVYTAFVGHPQLKAQLSLNCKHLFR